MLLTTSGNWEIIHASWPGYIQKDDKGRKLAKPVKHPGLSGITTKYVWKGEPDKSLLMFVGTTQDNFSWGGTLRHHRFLWKGQAVIMTGYDIKYLEQHNVESS